MTVEVGAIFTSATGAVIHTTTHGFVREGSAEYRIRVHLEHLRQDARSLIGLQGTNATEAWARVEVFGEDRTFRGKKSFSREEAESLARLPQNFWTSHI